MKKSSATESKVYQTRQWVTVLWIILPLVTLAVMLFDSRGQDGGGSVLLLLTINAVILVLFAHLRIRLAQGRLSWRFGVLALSSWSIEVSEIEHVEVCETPWSSGKGIRFTREGMLYNAAGSGAVRITKKDGTRLRLGSAEPDVLCACIKMAMASVVSS